MFNLSDILSNSAKRYPNNEAIVCGDTRMKYPELEAKTNQFANALLNLGIKPGDKVAFGCPNVPIFLVIYYGILKTGAVAVPISIMLKGNEIKHQLRNTDSKVFFCYSSTPKLPFAEYGLEAFNRVKSCEHFVVIDDGSCEEFTPPTHKMLSTLTKNQPTTFTSFLPQENETAVIIHTSGTTGVQKGAELSHTNLTMNAMVVSTSNVANIQSSDRLLAALPLNHVFGQTVMMNSGILSGATIVLMPRFDPNKVFQLMDSENITVFSGVPTMFWAMLRSKIESVNMVKVAKNLQTVISGGDSLPVEIFNNFKTKYNIEITEGYGMTEGSPVVTFSHKNLPLKPGSIGTALWGIEIKLVNDKGNEVENGEIGEIAFKGCNVMKGYYNNPKGTAEVLIDGWLHSGDLAIMDEDGFIFIVGRKKELIIRSGLNVYPKEVEMALMKHRAISMVCVVGVPDKIKGEEVKAFAVLKPKKNVSPSELRGWVNERIASYKCPKHIEIVDSLPMNATGKILKRVLKDGHWYDLN